MTLAFYGKSRKRQQALLFAAFLAIIAGALAGVSAWRGESADAAPLVIFEDELTDPALPGWQQTGNVQHTNGTVELSGDGSSIARPVSTVGYSNLVLSVTCRGVTANEGGGDDHDQLHVEYNTNGGTGSWPGIGFATYLASFGCPTQAANTVTIPLEFVYGANNNPDVVVRIRSGNHDGSDEKVIIESVKLEGEASVVTAELLPGALSGTQIAWVARFYNAGPAATMDLAATYAPNTTATNLAGTNGPISGCAFTSSTFWEDCEVQLNASNVNGGFTQVTFYTTAPTETCGGPATVTMQLHPALNGVQIPPRAGQSLSNEYTHPASTCEGDFTIDKRDSTELAGDGAYVEWEIWLHNATTLPETLHVRDIGATLVSSNCVGGNTATQVGDVITCAVPPGDAGGQPEATLTVFTAYNPTPLEECKGGTRTNYAELAQTLLPGDGLSDTATANLTPTLGAAHCITVEKTSMGEGSWVITFTNTGAAANVNFSDTYEGQQGQITSIASAGVELTSCSYDAYSQNATGCVLALPSGIQTPTVTTVTVVTDAVNTPACGQTTVTNTVRAFLGSSQVYEVMDSPAQATYTETDDDCYSTVRLCKSWVLDGLLEQADPDPQSFQFAVRDSSVGKGDPDTVVTIPNVMEGEGPFCIFLDVQAGLVSFDEVGPSAGFVFDGWTWANGSTPQESPIQGDNRPLFLNVQDDYCQYPVGALTGNLLGMVRDIQEIVIVTSEPGLVACTILFFNHDTDDRLPTGDLRIENYKDLNGDGDADDPGEGLIEGSFEMKKVGDPVATLWDLPGGMRTFPGLTPGDDYVITIGVPTGWRVTNATTDGYSHGPAQQVTATIFAGMTYPVRFYQQPPATPTPTPTTPTTTATPTAPATPTGTATPPATATSTPTPAVPQQPSTPASPTSPAPPATATTSPSTPAPASPTPAPVTIVAGEKTAAPADPTPVAPSTGSGADGGAGGASPVLMFAFGLLALSATTAFAALRKRRRAQLPAR